MTYAPRNISATLSSRASASAALGHGVLLQGSARSRTTFFPPACRSRNSRISASLLAIRLGFIPSCEAIIAASICAADSSEIVRSGSRFGFGGKALLRDSIPLSGEFTGARNRLKRNCNYTESETGHNAKAAPLQDRPLCCFQVFGRAPLKGAGNLWRLPEGFGAATPSRLRKPVSPPVDHLPCREIHGDDLGHVVVSKSAPVSEASPR